MGGWSNLPAGVEPRLGERRSGIGADTDIVLHSAVFLGE